MGLAPLFSKFDVVLGNLIIFLNSTNTNNNEIVSKLLKCIFYGLTSTTTTESSPLFAGVLSRADGQPCFLISSYLSVRRCMVAHI